MDVDRGNSGWKPWGRRGWEWEGLPHRGRSLPGRAPGLHGARTPSGPLRDLDASPVQTASSQAIETMSVGWGPPRKGLLAVLCRCWASLFQSVGAGTGRSCVRPHRKPWRPLPWLRSAGPGRPTAQGRAGSPGQSQPGSPSPDAQTSKEQSDLPLAPPQVSLLATETLSMPGLGWADPG